MAPSSDAARQYSRAHCDRFLQELDELLRIPSLSGDPAYAGDIQACGGMAGRPSARLGAENVAVMETAGHPVVYGEWLGAGPDKPTVLVYGHYDVVPAAIEDGWDTPPFEPVVKDGKIYARGATDDKGQLLIHVKALESYLETGDGPPVNVKFLLEGEEEVSSPNLRPFIEAHLDLLEADVCVISDSSMPTHRRTVDHAQPAGHDLHRGRRRWAARRPAQRVLTAARCTIRRWRWSRSWRSCTIPTTASPCRASTTMSCR